uniref:Rab-GAP TBC domain-containing protein n=1 Tax=Petromyzon marinus TaxID=7757 RepID=S4RB84_PETMA
MWWCLLNRCKSRKVRSLWWEGIPPSVRGWVWQHSIGNQLNITPELYEIFLARYGFHFRGINALSQKLQGKKIRLGASVAPGNPQLEAMTLDILSTFPDLHIFQKEISNIFPSRENCPPAGHERTVLARNLQNIPQVSQGGPYHDSLRNVLGAYATYRPDVGYAPMTSWLAAMLLLYMDAVEAFVVLANILNQPCMLAFALPRPNQVKRYLATFDVFFEENLPGLFAHFKKIGLLPDVYLGDWVLVLLAHVLPLECACRARDVWFRDGEEFAFRAALGRLSLLADSLLTLDKEGAAALLLARSSPAASSSVAAAPFPIPATQEEALFSAIAGVRMVSRRRSWAQVLALQ